MIAGYSVTGNFQHVCIPFVVTNSVSQKAGYIENFEDFYVGSYVQYGRCPLALGLNLVYSTKGKIHLLCRVMLGEKEERPKWVGDVVVVGGGRVRGGI